MSDANNLPPSLEGTTFVSSAGHLSAKLKKTHGDGTTTWVDYDTRTATSEPLPNESILVFNSKTGLYEEVKTLAEAKLKFEEHYSRLTYTVPVLTEEELTLRQKIKKLLAEAESLSATLNKPKHPGYWILRQKK